jgi:ribosome-binding protein aMBF1 (putative translation factor)
MIHSHSEYRESLRRLEAGKRQAAEYEAKLKEMGLGPEAVARGMASVIHFQEQLEDEIRRYEQLKRGELEEYWDIRDLGLLLVEARLARGLSQRALARKLGVHESQVSRDERNTYHGISHQRALEILDALGLRIRFRVELQPSAASLQQETVRESHAARDRAAAP